jgi:hypothetical protein
VLTPPRARTTAALGSAHTRGRVNDRQAQGVVLSPNRTGGSARASLQRPLKDWITRGRSRLCVQVSRPIAPRELEHGEPTGENKLAALPALRQDQKAFDDPRHGLVIPNSRRGGPPRIDIHETTPAPFTSAAGLPFGCQA